MEYICPYLWLNSMLLPNKITVNLLPSRSTTCVNITPRLWSMVNARWQRIEQRFWNFARRHVSSFLWNCSRKGKTTCSTKVVRCEMETAVIVHSKPHSRFLSVTVPLSWFRFYSSIHHFDLTLPTCISSTPLLSNLHF